MELQFDGGRFVCLRDDVNYREVLDDFPNAHTIRILTYNISKNIQRDPLLEALQETTADIQLITNVPSRMDQYYNSPAGQNMRSAARNNIQIYISKLNPDNFPQGFIPYFNVHNHSKIIGTENIVYIGSANYSNESAGNIETGILIEDKDFIAELYSKFFDMIKDESLSYFDESFSAFRLYVLSLNAKFQHHYQKMITDLYTDYERTKMTVSDAIFMDLNDLQELYLDLDELEHICNAADDTYDEDSKEYNKALEELKSRFDRLSIDWLKSVISEDGSLYDLLAYDIDSEPNRIIQEEYAFEAYDENLEYYMKKAMDVASETYNTLHDVFQEEADEFLAEIEKVLSSLDAAITFTDKWQTKKINPDIDNT